MKFTERSGLLSHRLLIEIEALPTVLNVVWSANIFSDTLYKVMRFRKFNMLEDLISEALAIEIDLLLPSVRLVCVFEQP